MENSNEKYLKALDAAIEQESDGVKFYTNAVDKCKHHLGKSMFQSFVEDEKEHLKRLTKLKNAEYVEPSNASGLADIKGAKDRLISVFNQMKDQLGAIIKPESDDLEAIKIAMDIERAGHKLYKDGADHATNDREKDLFKFLAKEEIIHYEILKNTYNYLNNLDKATAKDEDRSYDLWIRMINEA